MFTNRNKLTALSICHIFETSKPLGDSSSVAVLDDGAGISYGIPQATHKSGNLLDVIERYIAGADEPLYEPLFRKWIPTLRKTDQRTVNATAKNTELKRALAEAGNEPAMRIAQLGNINARMDAAVRACAGSGFVLPLSLAVIYDSMNHGSWAKIRDGVKVSADNEKNWIKTYVQHRQAWLKSVPRLAVTAYRTQFYLQQIAADNWDLKLPVVAHGFKLMDKHIDQAEQEMDNIAAMQGANDTSYAKTEETTDETPNAEQPTDGESKTIGTKITTTETQETDGGSKTVETEQNLLASTDQVVVKETPSFSSKIQAGAAWILSGGAAVVAGVKYLFDQIDQIPTVNVAIFTGAAVILAYVAYSIYNRSADRANQLNIEKMRLAADRSVNTVHLISSNTAATAARYTVGQWIDKDQTGNGSIQGITRVINDQNVTKQEIQPSVTE